MESKIEATDRWRRNGRFNEARKKRRRGADCAPKKDPTPN
jgi:hypothetical protein